MISKSRGFPRLKRRPRRFGGAEVPKCQQKVLPNRIWVVVHPVVWSVSVGAALVLLGMALDLPPILVVAAGTGVGVLNILHARRRGYCPLPDERSGPADS